MSKKRRVFSVEDLKREVKQEFIFQRQFDQFEAADIGNPSDLPPKMCESWLVAKYGLKTTFECIKFLKTSRSIPDSQRKHNLGKLFYGVDIKHYHVIETCSRAAEKDAACEASKAPTARTDVDEDAACVASTARIKSTVLLFPPTNKCLL